MAHTDSIPEEIMKHHLEVSKREGVHVLHPDLTCSCKENPVVREVREQAARFTRANICPECRAGKHGNCDGTAFDEYADDIVECRCPPAFGHQRKDS